MNQTNGKAPAANEQQLIATLNAMAANELTMRTRMAQTMLDPRRDLNKECGYPERLDPWGYWELYKREPVANAVVRNLPNAAWKMPPSVYEDEDPDVQTEFEQAWDDLGSALQGLNSAYRDETGSPVYSLLKRWNTMSRVNSYGILLLGTDDVKTVQELQQPVAGLEEVNSVAEGKSENPGDPSRIYQTNTSQDGVWRLLINKQKTANRRLRYATVFPEVMAQITQWETNPTSPRYGRPVMYQLTPNDPRYAGFNSAGAPQATLSVHWTRVCHLVDYVESNETIGVPACEVALNPLLDIRKVRGASAEMYWMGAFPFITAETHPQLGGDVDVDVSGMRQMFENAFNSLQRFMLGKGMTFKTVAPMVSPPNQQLDALIEAVAIATRQPMRILKGSERGELSSQQDSDGWEDEVKGYRRTHCSPNVLVNFCDHLQMIGVLPRPKQYSAGWEDDAKLKPQEKASIGMQKTSSLMQYVQGNLSSEISPIDYWTKFQGFDDEEAKAIIENATLAQEEAPEDKPDQTAQMIGGGIGQILTQLSQGMMTPEAALYLLTEVYKVDPAEAQAMLPPEPDPNAPEEPGQDAQMVSGGIGQILAQLSQGMMTPEAALHLLSEVYKVDPAIAETMLPEDTGPPQAPPVPPAQEAMAAPGVTTGITGLLQQATSGVLTPEAAKVLLTKYFAMLPEEVDQLLPGTGGEAAPPGWEEIPTADVDGAESAEEAAPPGWEEIPTEEVATGADDKTTEQALADGDVPEEDRKAVESVMSGTSSKPHEEEA